MIYTLFTRFILDHYSSLGCPSGPWIIYHGLICFAIARHGEAVPDIMNRPSDAQRLFSPLLPADPSGPKEGTGTPQACRGALPSKRKSIGCLSVMQEAQSESKLLMMSPYVLSLLKL